MSLGVCLMLNDAAVCGERVCLKIFGSVWSDMWKSCEIGGELIRN